MEGIVDRLLLLGCSLALLFTVGVFNEVTAVVAFLIAIIISALNGLTKSKVFLLCSLLAFTGVAWFWHDFVFFLPLVYYDLGLGYSFEQRSSLVSSGLSVLFVVLLGLPVKIGLITIILAITSQILAQRTNQLNISRKKWKELRDDSYEINQLLQEKNKELRAKQDYGIRMARLNERSRIAREIHDHVGHLLSRSILQIGALLVMEKEESAQKNLVAVKDTLTQAMDRIRLSVHGLYEESLDLETQLEELIGDFTFCPVKLDYRLEQSPDKEIENCFVAIIKEGLNNIVRHSNATQVKLTLLEQPSFYQLILQDNGTNVAEKAPKGLGLRSIADRVEALGGNFVHEHDGGFRLFISVPKGGMDFESVTS